MLDSERYIVTGTLLSFLLVLLCSPTGLRAESNDSLCVQFMGDAHIELMESYTMSASMPVTLCEMRRGDRFRMIVNGGDFERRIGTFAIAHDGRISVRGIRIGAALRNALLPGFGSCFSGRRAVGWIDGLSLAASMYMLYEEDREFRDLEDTHKDLMQKLAEAELLETKKALELQAHEVALEANTQNKHRKRLAVLSAALYGIQVLDPFLLSQPPGSSAGERGNMIRIESPRRSTAKAFLYSLVHPGRGQFYQGKNIRGLFFSAAAVASGLTALELHNRYDREALRYEILIDRYEAASTIDEKERIFIDASRQWDEVDDAKTIRNAAYIVTAGLWGWNLLDTLWQGERETKAARYSFEWSPLEGAVVLRF
jgi:hypothetical protein